MSKEFAVFDANDDLHIQNDFSLSANAFFADKTV